LLSAFNAYGQTSLREGDACFDAGDYACAIIKYNAAFERLSGKEKQKVEIKLLRARRCAEHIALANQAFSNGNYKTAKEKYSIVLESNPNDKIAQARIEECESFLNPPPPPSLNVSPSQLSFSATGGNRQINVTTNATSFSVSGLPSWCSIQKYSNYFVITCNANPVTTTRTGYCTVTAGDKAVTVNISQTGKAVVETTLHVSTENLSFYASGGTSEQIKVYSNANSYSVSLVPSWCMVKTYSGYFVVTCSANNSTNPRSDWFKVSAGGKDIQINIHQNGNPPKSQPKPQTTLSVSNDDLYFAAKGGKSERIEIYSNASTYSVSNVPYWYKVLAYNGYIVVDCDANKSRTNRQNYFTVIAGDKKQRIYVTQESKKLCFNCPKAKYPWGLSVGYVSKETNYYNDIDGIQIGIRFEPLFKYGFGLNMGLNYEHYYTTYENYYQDGYKHKYEENALNIPFHLEYRLNFSKYFNIFAYSGIGFDIINASSASASDFATNFTFDYGGGLRINHIQLNIGKSARIKDADANIFNGMSLYYYKNLVISMAYMF
ncbi:MAG: outer membrane beta-barrel protein, partial [Tannerella sp.]|nr:outer membrane beta-barrel protein [Tannerella sp.]